MASIDKMEIRGIRAFSPEENQVIEFYSPLTMIVGANGCGRTTIIESLKFVCSGVLPPGAKNGQSFINDPQMTDSAEIKSHVKLRFQNRRGYECVATRNLQVTRKKNKLEFKALDSVLKTVDDRGEVSSISMKCSELDRQIPDYLGVSAAVMENVIFCHQEESDWPMQDGASVKKRFDDIFDSTRYSKALEAIHKTKKELVSTGKDLKAEFSEIAERLRAAGDYREELKCNEEDVERAEAELKALADKCDQFAEKIRSLRDTVNRQQASRREYEDLEIRISETSKRILEKETGLERIYDCSDQELQSNLDNFDAMVQQKTKELREIQHMIDRTNSEIQASRDDVVSHTSKLAGLERMMSQLDHILTQQKDQFFSIGKKYGIPPVFQAFEEFKPCFEEKTSVLKNELRRDLEAARSKVKSEEKLLQEKVSADQRLEFEYNHLSNEIKRLTQDINEKRIQLNNLSSAQKDLTEAQREFQDATAVHDEFLVSFQTKTNEFRRLMKEYNDKIRVIDDEYSADDLLLQDMNMNRQDLALISANEKRLDEDFNSIRSDLMSLFNHRQELLREISNHVPIDLTGASCTASDIERIKVFLEDNNSQLKSRNASENSESRNIEKEIAKLSAMLQQENNRLLTLKHQENSFSEKQRVLRGIHSEIFRMRDKTSQCGLTFDNIDNIESMSMNELLEMVNQCCDDIRDVTVIHQASASFKSKLNKKKAKTNSCPICKQCFPNESVSGSFEKNVEDFLVDVYKMGISLEDASGCLVELTDIRDRIVGLVKDMEPLQGFRLEYDSCTQKISELKSSIGNFESKLEVVTKSISDINELLSIREGTLSELNEILQRWRSVEAKRLEIAEKKRRQTQSMSGIDSGGRTFEDIDRQQRDRREMKDDLLKKKERLRNDEDSLNKRMSVIKSNMMEKEKLVADAKLKGSRYGDLEAQMKSNTAEVETLTAKQKSIGREREDVKKVLNDLTSTFNISKAEFTTLEEKFRALESAVSSEFNNIMKLNDDIVRLRGKVSPDEINQLKLTINALNKEIADKDEISRTFQPQYQAVLSEMNNQERHKKTYVQNIELRKAKLELRLLKEEQEIKGSRLEMDANKLADLQRQLLKAEKDSQVSATERDKLRGKLENYQLQTQNLLTKLESNLFAGIDEKHRKKLIELETTELAIKDLDNYYQALDNALQSFHTQKIKEINKIIRELWQLIYKGEDIDMIEVESGQEAGAVTATKSTRSYNYRVVMREGTIPLDMRGRCSAGQRVLASIVIRLALAETFCLNCGILALDEPTTNLDEKNKIGLASALARIIHSRSRQQNFQLICITHDEEFLRLMNLELSAAIGFSKPEYYFRISRTEEGNSGRFFSKIDRIPWDDMH